MKMDPWRYQQYCVKYYSVPFHECVESGEIDTMVCSGVSWRGDLAFLFWSQPQILHTSKVNIALNTLLYALSFSTLHPILGNPLTGLVKLPSFLLRSISGKSILLKTAQRHHRNDERP